MNSLVDAVQPIRLSRSAAAAFHLLASAVVATFGALLIFRLWYPSPFGTVAGGTTLFLLLVSVDVVLGPMLTFVAATPGKSVREFRRDLAIIVTLQIAAFAYGVHTIAIARPVYISFEIDRFRVITAADVDASLLGEAPADLRSMPWLGPKMIAAVKPTDPAEQLKSIDLGLAGFDLSMVPKNWRSYESRRSRAWHAARPVGVLLNRHPELKTDLSEIAQQANRPIEDLRFLPLMSHQVSWIAVLEPVSVRIVGYLPVDGFF